MEPTNKIGLEVISLVCSADLSEATDRIARLSHKVDWGLQWTRLPICLSVCLSPYLHDCLFAFSARLRLKRTFDHD